MANTLLPKPESLKGGFHRSKQLFVVFIALLSFISLYGVYSQHQQNSLQIDLLISEIQMQKLRIQHLEEKMPRIEEKLHQQATNIMEPLESLVINMNQHKDDKVMVFDQIHELSERLEKIEEIVDLKSQIILKEIDQTRNSLGNYMKSEDFFQIINDMVEKTRKRFKLITQDLNQKNEIIQNLLQATQLKSEIFTKQEDYDEEFENFREESMTKTVGESFGELKSKITDGAEKIKEFTKSTQEKLVHHATGSMEKVKELAHSTGENLEAVKVFVVTNAEKVKEFSKTAGEKIGPIKEKVIEQAQHMKEGVQKIGKDLGEKAKNFAKRFF